MFLSIIIPIYNDEKYIKECLNSCLNQDISTDDYEIICVDDGSTDATRDILELYQRQHSNVILLFKEHQGGGRGRNSGYEIAKGDYVWFVDHDDVIRENVLGILKGTVSRHDCDRLVFSVYVFSNELTEEERLQLQVGELKANGAMYRNAIWAGITKRSFLVKNNIWPRTKLIPDNEPLYFSDGFFVSECQIANAVEYEIDSQPVYFYRLHKNQETRNLSDKAIRNKIKGLINQAAACKRLVDDERTRLGSAREATVNNYMQWVRTAASHIAGMPRQFFSEGVHLMKEASIYPVKTPKESTYSCKNCIHNNRRYGQSTFRCIAYYYSGTRLGLRAYRILCWKGIVSNAMRKNRLLCSLLKTRK